ncbi:hypothetical protein [Luteococcus sp.]|uniref:hypothetical protein n=1 Tax=Luteococcus sp. TaxID=1969402 RepID=UPI003736A4B8
MRDTSRSDLLALVQISRSTFYNMIDAKPTHFGVQEQELPFEETDDDVIEEPAVAEQLQRDSSSALVEGPVTEGTLGDALPDALGPQAVETVHDQAAAE